MKSDGELTYFASDIAYHRNKFERHFDKLINVWGADHHGYVPRLKAAMRGLGYDPNVLQVVLVQMVQLTRGGEPVRMGKRTGEFVSLEEVLQEVGRDAARFFFLMRKSDSHLDFDLELAKRQSSDNPVFYVQYAHARVASIFEQARRSGLLEEVVHDDQTGSAGAVGTGRGVGVDSQDGPIQRCFGRQRARAGTASHGLLPAWIWPASFTVIIIAFG